MGDRHPSATTWVESERMKSSSSSFPLCCNKCRQPIQAAAFVCACNCVFCDSCANAHFSNNSRCPRCGRNLNEEDFYDVTVTDKMDLFEGQLKRQVILTKRVDDSSPITWSDICHNIMSEQESLLRNTQLFVTQFTRESEGAVRACGHWKQKATHFEMENIKLKTQVQKLQETVKLQGSQLGDQKNHIQELQAQLEQELRSRTTVACISSGTSSRTSSKRGSTPQPESLPFVRRMHHKEKKDLDQERMMNPNSRPILSLSRVGQESLSSHSLRQRQAYNDNRNASRLLHQSDFSLLSKYRSNTHF